MLGEVIANTSTVDDAVFQILSVFEQTVTHKRSQLEAPFPYLGSRG
jgi:hypothetical protein